MTVTVFVPEADLRDRTFVVEATTSGDAFNITSASGRQVIAQADTAEELVKWAKKKGAKRTEVFRGYGTPKPTKNWKWKPVKSPKTCDRKSFRILKVGKGARRRLLRVCCPRGKFSRGVCSVGMKLQSVAQPRRK